RLARKRRRRRRGPVDLRHTVRRSLSTGGVPIDLRFKPPRPSKPEIIVIADISGSVASFARFTLHLVHAISSQFSKVRSFVFVDGLDEVTSLFDGADDPSDAVARINSEADVIAFDGHSDYGRAFLTFHEHFADAVTMRTTILILGDARNNYHQAHAEVLADLRYRAKALYWLNPEPTSYWNSGDSIVNQYAPYCDRVIECRTLRQLEAFVGELA
ncbi:MAG: VWA domain-containing protein, partial [Acidimicrobiales bacterium]